VALEVSFSVEKISIVATNDMVAVTERKALKGVNVCDLIAVLHAIFLYDKGVFFNSERASRTFPFITMLRVYTFNLLL
jgi:hypothetical protein